MKLSVTALVVSVLVASVCCSQSIFDIVGEGEHQFGVDNFCHVPNPNKDGTFIDLTPIANATLQAPVFNLSRHEKEPPFDGLYQLNLCAPEVQLPSCGTTAATYVTAYFSNSTCMIPNQGFVTPPKVSLIHEKGNGVMLDYGAGKSDDGTISKYQFRVFLMCGSSDQLQSRGSYVNLDDEGGQWITVVASSATLCPLTRPPTEPPVASCGVVTPWGEVNMSSIPALEANITYNKTTTKTVYTDQYFKIDLCETFTAPPTGYEACKEGGYLGEWNMTTKKCVGGIPTPFSWRYMNGRKGEAIVGTQVLGGSTRVAIDIVVICGDTLDLQVVKPWTGFRSRRTNIWTDRLVLSSSIACKPTSAPGAPPATQGPTLPPAPGNRSYVIVDKFKGQNCDGKINKTFSVPTKTCLSGFGEGHFGSMSFKCVQPKAKECATILYDAGTDCTDRSHTFPIPCGQCLKDPETPTYYKYMCNKRMKSARVGYECNAGCGTCNKTNTLSYYQCTKYAANGTKYAELLSIDACPMQIQESEWDSSKTCSGKPTNSWVFPDGSCLFGRLFDSWRYRCFNPDSEVDTSAVEEDVLRTLEGKLGLNGASSRLDRHERFLMEEGEQ